MTSAVIFVAALEETPKTLQGRSMQRFFWNSYPEVTRSVREGHSYDEICRWGEHSEKFDVECENNALIKLQIEDHSDIGHFEIAFLPNSLREVWIVKCDQSCKIHTRLFPRSANSINLAFNRHFGAPDLTTLPTNIKDLSLMENKLTGPIQLCRLPKELRYLNLLYNLIKQDVVFYEDLPECIQIYLTQSEGFKDPSVRAVPGTSKVKTRKNFPNLKESCIH